MKIVFLNTKAGKIEIYSQKGCQIWDFAKASMLPRILGTEKFLYVTNATITDSRKIASLVSKLAPQTTDENIQESSTTEEVKDEVCYLHSTSKGKIILGKTGIVLSPSDFLKLSDLFIKFGEDVFEKTPIFKKLLENKTLEIVTQSEKNKIIAGQLKEMQKSQNAKDKGLDDILEDSVDAALKKAEDGDGEPDDIAIDIDLDKERSFRGVESNEGSLLPEDF